MTPGAFLSGMVDALVDGLAPLAARFRPRSRVVVVDGEAGLRVFAVDGGRVREMPEADLSGRRLRRAARGGVELRLPPERLVARQLQLPAAGRDFLGSIIEHRIERLTPWRPEKVVYGFAVAGVPAADGTMAVDFLATSAEIAAERRAALARHGLEPTALGSAAEPVETPLRIDMLRGAGDVGRARLRRRVVSVLVLAAVLLVPAVAASQWFAMEADARLADLERRLATKRQVLRTATGDTEQEARDLRLINAKTPATSAMVLVDRLANVLPDDTWLRELEIDGAGLRIAGQSGNAPALIPLLEAEESLGDVRFAAPVTRDEDGRDGFDIVARWLAREAPADGQAAALRTGALP